MAARGITPSPSRLWWCPTLLIASLTGQAGATPPQPGVLTNGPITAIPYKLGFFGGFVKADVNGSSVIRTNRELVDLTADATAALVKAYADGEGAAFEEAGRASVYSYVAPLGDGKLVVYSPGDPAQQKDELAKLGTVAVVVVGTPAHDHFAIAFQKAYPHAIMVATAAVQRDKPGLRIDHMLGWPPGVINATVPLPPALDAELRGTVDFYFNPLGLFEMFMYHKASQVPRLVPCPPRALPVPSP